MEIEEYHIHSQQCFSGLDKQSPQPGPFVGSSEIPTMQRMPVLYCIIEYIVESSQLSLNSSPKGAVEIFTSYAGLICDKKKIFPAEIAFATFQGF